jgi:hypothetical protein
MDLLRPAGAGPVRRLLPARGGTEDALIRQAAWVARCVGRGDTAPLRPEDVTALAATLTIRDLEAGTVVFKAGEPAGGV